MTLSRLQPGFHHSTTANGFNKPRLRGFPAKRASGRPLGAGETHPHSIQPVSTGFLIAGYS